MPGWAGCTMATMLKMIVIDNFLRNIGKAVAQPAPASLNALTSLSISLSLVCLRCIAEILCN